jgi:hypothetical protein
MSKTTTTKDVNKRELLGLFVKLSTRVDMLPDKQRTFVRLFLGTQKYRPIAKMAGVNEVTIARRLKRIAEQISSNNFIAALSQENNLSPEKMEILKDYFVTDLPMIRIAKNRNLSCYMVRKIIRTSNPPETEKLVAGC